MNEGWWLKVRRAEKHMVDIKQEAMRYAESNPYSFTRIRLLDRHKQIRGRFNITEQPDPMIAVMLGDFVHNLRSALDYIIVACVPKQRRGKASFPILFEDIFAKNEEGDFMVNDADLRKRTESAIKGLHPEARAFIIKLQPYHAGILSHLNILGIISRLENADKHRQLITIGCGGRDFFLYFTHPDFPQSPIRFNEPLGINSQFLKDNTPIPWDFPPEGLPRLDGSLVKPSEMDVHFSGSVKILIQIPGIRGNQPPDNFLLDTIMPNAVLEVTTIINRLESFVCKT